MLEKPMNARDISPAVISVIGEPLNNVGTGAPSMRSRRPANSTSTSEKPAAAPKPYRAEVRKVCFFCTFSSATPSTAQFVVISGRKMPRAWYITGLVLWIIISMNCTSAAMIRMKKIVCRYRRCSGINRYCCTSQETVAARVITNITANDIPTAVSTLPDTPRNGQMPRNLVNTKLLTSTADSRTTAASPMGGEYKHRPWRGTPVKLVLFPV